MATDGFPDEPDAERAALDGKVDEAERESFPASAPPSSWAGADATPAARRDGGRPDGPR